MRRRYFVWAASVLVAVACADAGPAEPDGSLAPLAELYLGEAVDIMEDNSVKRHEIDWVAFREDTYADAIGARNPVGTYPAIVAALERIGDNHSFFSEGGPTPSSSALSTPQAAEAAGRQETGSAAPDPRVERVQPGIGYVEVPAFSGGGRAANDFAAAYHRRVEEVDALEHPCRWIIDLRGNTGGNMWPMIAGVGPILGEGTVGLFVDADGVLSPWFYEAGRAGVDELVLVEVANPYQLEYAFPHVAVLTDSLTASAGEAVAVAFRGRPATRSFGEPTWGVSTANAAFPLSDGAVIFLTVATLADRAGNVYGLEVVPDEVVFGEFKRGDPDTDPVLDAALEWLASQQCR